MSISLKTRSSLYGFVISTRWSKRPHSDYVRPSNLAVKNPFIRTRDEERTGWKNHQKTYEKIKSTRGICKNEYVRNAYELSCTVKSSRGFYFVDRVIGSIDTSLHVRSCSRCPSFSPSTSADSKTKRESSRTRTIRARNWGTASSCPKRAPTPNAVTYVHFFFFPSHSRQFL